MSKEYFELGSSPVSEDCVQVESGKDYHTAMQEELKRYKTMLEARFPVPSDIHAWFGVKWFPHDFGSYGEVVIYFQDDEPESVDFACHVEDNLPDTWDDTSLIRYVTRDVDSDEEFPIYYDSQGNEHAEF